MAIQKIRATKTASLTDLRNPMSVIKAAGNSSIAIMNRNKVLGYFIPESMTKAGFSYTDDKEFHKVLKTVLKKGSSIINYLKDK